MTEEEKAKLGIKMQNIVHNMSDDELQEDLDSYLKAHGLLDDAIEDNVESKKVKFNDQIEDDDEARFHKQEYIDRRARTRKPIKQTRYDYDEFLD